ASLQAELAGLCSEGGEPEQLTIAGRGGLCAIYPVRLTQCRTYPFWKSILDRASDSAWRSHADQCPGIGRGKHWSKAEILDRRAPSNL
ncbi:MAG: YkgJ family cysteine cluster protein, partial [Planctomycetota bacterium]